MRKAAIESYGKSLLSHAVTAAFDRDAGLGAVW